MRLVGALAVRSAERTSVVGLPLVVAFFGVGRLWWLQEFRGGLVVVFGSPDGYGIPLLWFVALVFLGGAVRWGCCA